MNLETPQAEHDEADTRQRPRRLGGQALAAPVDVDPIADLAGAGADPKMQARAAQDLALVAIEDAVGVILTGFEAAPKTPEPRRPSPEQFGLVPRPRHPRAQVIEVGPDCLVQQRRIGLGPAPDNQTRRSNSGRRPLPLQGMSSIAVLVGRFSDPATRAAASAVAPPEDVIRSSTASM